MTNEFDIAIIGAGAAGIGAARRLDGGELSVIVLEALSRPGGRAWTRTAAGLPLDLGCGWLHSADRNPWTRIAEERGLAVDRRIPAWRTQYRDLGFPPAEQKEADHVFTRWFQQLAGAPPPSDNAADVLELGSRWTPYLQAMSGFISGDELERVSARDFTAYDAASTGRNWRLPAGYGALVAASLPSQADLHLATPVETIALDQRHRVALRTPEGTVRARAVILTISTNILVGGTIAMPPALDPWRDAAARLPLGYDEKLFLEIVGDSAFEPESHVLGDPYDATTGSYYIRPFGWPVIECYFGGDGARMAAANGLMRPLPRNRSTRESVRLVGKGVPSTACGLQLDQYWHDWRSLQSCAPRPGRCARRAGASVRWPTVFRGRSNARHRFLDRPRRLREWRTRCRRGNCNAEAGSDAQLCGLLSRRLMASRS